MHFLPLPLATRTKISQLPCLNQSSLPRTSHHATLWENRLAPALEASRRRSVRVKKPWRRLLHRNQQHCKQILPIINQWKNWVTIRTIWPTNRRRPQSQARREAEKLPIRQSICLNQSRRLPNFKRSSRLTKISQLKKSRKRGTRSQPSALAWTRSRNTAKHNRRSSTSKINSRS